MTVEDVIDAVLDREQAGHPPYLAPNDAGGRTSWGIAERFHPEAWQPGPPTRAQAKQILLADYAAPFAPLRAVGLPDALWAALVDDAVLSGVSTAIKRLQVVLGERPDGIIGPSTIAAVRLSSQLPATLVRAFVVERVTRLCRLVQQRPADLTNLVGWVTRALAFLP